MQLSMLRDPDSRPMPSAGHGWPGSRVRGAASRLLCEECGDGQLAADATSPVVHQVCTAMSRERPEAALRSYGHFSWRRANDQHAHATFPNHNPTSYTNGSIATPLLTSKRTWCDFCQTSQLGVRGPVLRGWRSRRFLSPLRSILRLIKSNTGRTSIVAG